MSLPSVCCPHIRQRPHVPSILARCSRHVFVLWCFHPTNQLLFGRFSFVKLSEYCEFHLFLNAKKTIPVLFFVQAAETDKRQHRLLAVPLHADVREPLLHQKVSGGEHPAGFCLSFLTHTTRDSVLFLFLERFICFFS